MGLFTNILEKLGIKKKEDASASASASTSAGKTPAKPASSAGVGAGVRPGMKPASSAHAADMAHGAAHPSAPKAISEVDVVAKLEGLAKDNPAKLNWKTSIVDLLKLLDLDSSGTARKEMAEELGCPDDMMHDSAKMNTWLHKAVLKKIAENGGNIPQELLD